MHLTCLLIGAAAGLAVTLLWFRREERWKQEISAERRQAAEDLERERQTRVQAHAQQRALFESMAEGVLLLDRHGKITMANQSFRELLSVSGDIRGKTILEAVRLPALSEIAAQLVKMQVLRNAELDLTHSSAGVLEVNASPVADERGSYQGAIFVFHDLTRLKQLESTRREFVANVSHELRTPLSLIKGFVETLLDGAKDDPDQTERFLGTIQKHTNRLTFLIEDLLTISRLESGPVALSLQSVALFDLSQRVVDDLRVKATERRIQIANLVPTDLKAFADADRLQQVIFNLVENAIKYGREAGEIVVGAERAGDSEVRISVKDDGPGIPLEAQARVFERFYRVDRARSRETGGTGLGLAIVKHIVQAHGGNVGVESLPGCGTLFYFTVPRAGAERRPAARLEEAVLTRSAGTLGLVL